MCRSCWGDYGSPHITSDATKAAAKLIDDVYELSSAGGALHIIIDDWNLDDESFDYIASKHAHDLNDAERACFDALRAFSLDERASALAIAEHFFPVHT